MTKPDPEQEPEQSGENNSKSARPDGHSRGEAIAGLPALGKSRKDLIAFLKAGGKSGISVDFGKPSIDGLVDDKVISKVQQSTQADRPSADYSFKATTAEQLQNAIAKSDKSKESLESVKYDDSELRHARLEPDKINAQYDAKLGSLEQQPASPAVNEERARVQSDKEYANARMEDNIQRLQTLEQYHDKEQDLANKQFEEEKRLESARRVSLESTYADFRTADDYKRGYETQSRTFVVSSTKLDGIEEFVFSDGTVERFDAQTNTATFTERNGSIHIYHFNQCTYKSMPIQDNCILHESKSHNPAYEYIVISKGAHKWVAVDSAKREIELSKNSEVIKARDPLCRELESSTKDPEQLARIRANIAKLENRIHDPKELVETYHQICRLLAQNPRLNEKRRLQLISELLSQSANPYTVDQGLHNTCNVNTIETTLYNDCPSKVCKLVADVACTGKFEYLPGKFVEIDRPVAYFMHEIDSNGKTSPNRTSKTFNPFKPDEEARQKFLQDGTRSYASQIFQVTAIQSIFATEQTNPKIQYVQMNRPLKDRLKTSERIVDEHGNMIGDVPMIFAPQIARAYFMIAGDKAKPEIIIGHPDFAHAGRGVAQFTDLNEFQRLIEKAKKEHRLPLIMAVDTRNEPFYSDSGRGAAGGSGGGHVVTITDYIPGPPGKVRFDNQWGSWRDHGKGKEVSLRDMYMAAFSYRSAGHAWWSIAKAARDSGKIDLQAEYELWRRSRERQAFNNEQNRSELISGVGSVSDSEFIQLTLQLILDAERYYKENEDESSVQFDKQFQQDFYLLPKSIKRQIARSMQRSPILSTRTNMLIEQCK